MGKSTVSATLQSKIQLGGFCLLGLLAFLAAGCRSPLTKDVANGGSTISVFERPDPGYRPSESGFKSTRLQPSFAKGKKTPKGNLPGSGNNSNISDSEEEEYDVENDPNFTGLQKSVFRRQQMAVKNMTLNTDDVANPDRIRSERATNLTASSKGDGFKMQFSDERGGSEVVEVVEHDAETLVAVEKQDQPIASSSSRNTASKESQEKVTPFATNDAQKSTDKKNPKPIEVKQAPVQKASASVQAVVDGAKSNDSEVIEASATTDSATKSEEPKKQESVDWQVHARRAIAALETEQQKTQLTPELKQSIEGALRLMNLATGDLDNALKPIEKMPSDEQQYVRNTIQALHHAFDPEGNPLASRRYALVLESNRKAQTSAATVANLEVRNVAFCTEVDRFGMITKFPQYQFQAKQECLLYCEVDNFVAVPVKGGFETELQGSYEIVDSSGRRVADELLPLDKDFCSNLRRDYFIPYRIYMPNDIQPGKYQLKLTIEDMKGRKFGQSIVDFRIGQ